MKLLPIAVATGVAILVGVPVASGFLLENKIDKYVEQYNNFYDPYAIEFTAEFDRGLLSSNAIMHTSIDADKARQLLSNMPEDEWQEIAPLFAEKVCVNYTFDHALIGGFNLASYEANPCFTGKLQEVVEELWAGEDVFNSQGSISFAGTWHDQTTINSLSFENEQDSFHFSELQVNSIFGSDMQLSATIRSKGIQYQGEEDRLLFGPVNLTAEYDLSQLNPGFNLVDSDLNGSLGNMNFTSQDGEVISIIDITVRASQTVNNELMDSSFRLGAQTLSIPQLDFEVKKLNLQQSLTNLNVIKLNELMEFFEQNYDPKTASAELLPKAQPILADLVKTKPKFAFDDLSFEIDGKPQKLLASMEYTGSGNLAALNWRKDLNIEVEVEFTKSHVLKALTSTNKVKLLAMVQDPELVTEKARAMSEQQLAMAAMMGFVKETDGGQLTSHLVIKDGAAKLNENPIDPLLDQGLTM